MRAWLLCIVACGAPARSSDPVKPATPVKPPSPSPAPDPEPTSAIPTVTSPCDDVRQDVAPELVADFDHPTRHENPGIKPHPLLCWGDDCVWTGEAVRRPTPRAVTIEHQPQVGDKLLPTTPVAIVKDGKVCTGDRCDELGPKLRAAIAADTETPVHATSDREAIVVGNEAWSRKRDAPLVLPPPRSFEGDVVTIHVLGNRLAVGRSCNEYCAELGTIVDSRGRLVARGFVFGNPIASIPDPIDLAGDRFLIFSGFGDVTLIDKGKPVASTHVGAEGGNAGAAPVPARVLALALDSDDVALEVCTPVGCQLANLRVSEWSGTPKSTHLEYYVVRQLPRCSTDTPSY